MKTATCINCSRLRPIKTRGMCESCYSMFRRRRDSANGKKRVGKPCMDCGGPRTTNEPGRCADCYIKHRNQPTVCPGCNRLERCYLYGVCQDCYKLTIGEERKRVLLERKVKAVRKYALKALFKLSPEQYDIMLAAQGGHCACCPATHDGKIGKDGDERLKKLAVDHDHKTGVIRGLLCTGCNTSLGRLGEDPARIRKLADYAERGGVGLRASTTA